MKTLRIIHHLDSGQIYVERRYFYFFWKRASPFFQQKNEAYRWAKAQKDSILQPQ